MYRHALLAEGQDVLCVTGSGYGTALLARRLGDDRVTSVDIDTYGVKVAGERLDSIGLHPRVEVADITGPQLPGEFDRIVSTVAVRTIPPAWLTALRPGGRLVTTLADTGIVITADVTRDGGARGHVTMDRAGFMAARTGEDYPPADDLTHAWVTEGDAVTLSQFPVLHVAESWELRSMMALAVPGIRHEYREDPDGVRTAVMAAPDGSWARASGRDRQPAAVHQSGPQRLWSVLDGIRYDWLAAGQLPVHGAAVAVDPDGTVHFSRGDWGAVIRP
jgi:SAM-dependent methyltransferase